MKSFLLIILLSVYVYPQCSDAGVCSIGEHNSMTDKNLRVGLSYVYGNSGKTDDISYSSISLESDYRFLESTSIYLSLPFSFQSGPLGDVSGIGDLLFIINQNIYKTDNLSLNIQGGLKLATGDDNSENLPQMYQSGLGSNDIIFGTSLSYENFSAAIGYQAAGSRNNNIQRVERGDDLLLSGGYTFSFLEQLTLNLQLLFIKRLSETTIADTMNQGNFTAVPESDNLQVNSALSISYMVSEVSEIKLFGAVPFKKRPVNIDGLTRAVSFSAGFFLHF
jgi:hypothetical protein